MKILNDKKLANYVTMRIGGFAKDIIAVENEDDIIEAYEYAKKANLPTLTLGAGSNIVFRDEGFNGVVILNKIPGLLIDSDLGYVQASGGVIWDDVVRKTIQNNLCGIEALTSIPGTCGAAPVNNIGAYSQELKDSVEYIRAYDTLENRFVDIDNFKCNFGYRNSRFKSKDYGRFIISKISLRLNKTPINYCAPDYPSLLEELEKRQISKPKPTDVQQALNYIRNKKLPNPKVLPNTGSFFKNPIVSTELANKLLAKYPNMPIYPQNNDTTKLAAGWLVEQAGLKGYKQNGIWVYDKQALVLINESANSFKELWLMAEHIIKTVQQEFGVMLDPEPEII